MKNYNSLVLVFLFINLNYLPMSAKPIVYLLPGLGLSPAIFDNLKLEAKEIHYLEWLTPTKRESLKNYVARLAEGIDSSKGKVVLIGHSFGGICMQEISKIIPTQKVILLSSIKSKKENPASFKFWLRILPLYKLGGKKIMLNTFKTWGPKHGYRTAAAQKVLIEAVAQHESYYFKWATEQVCKWQKTGHYPAPIVHIHGTKDKTFPWRKIQKPFITVPNGSHIMLYNMGDKISEIINKELLSNG